MDSRKWRILMTPRRAKFGTVRVRTMENIVKSFISPPRRCTPETWEVSSLTLSYNTRFEHTRLRY
ncbi:rap guanine nucleotide exchange factor 3 isoform X2 [Xyrichtys novacula]|uniref:Rap guanine nucleotide exchange factor 3 isoform X2 n=1 Tax=Xyrichtys novacula TaxID=13765 RepID=A0AAV1HEP0_XYRNO|nr:rap guanine nucleotide exchange factor 3 isoform X2 [Xyrichtys novacula]